MPDKIGRRNFMKLSGMGLSSLVFPEVRFGQTSEIINIRNVIESGKECPSYFFDSKNLALFFFEDSFDPNIIDHLATRQKLNVFRESPVSVEGNLELENSISSQYFGSEINDIDILLKDMSKTRSESFVIMDQETKALAIIRRVGNEVISAFDYEIIKDLGITPDSNSFFSLGALNNGIFSGIYTIDNITHDIFFKYSKEDKRFLLITDVNQESKESPHEPSFNRTYNYGNNIIHKNLQREIKSEDSLIWESQNNLYKIDIEKGTITMITDEGDITHSIDPKKWDKNVTNSYTKTPLFVADKRYLGHFKVEDKINNETSPSIDRSFDVLVDNSYTNSVDTGIDTINLLRAIKMGIIDNFRVNTSPRELSQYTHLVENKNKHILSAIVYTVEGEEKPFILITEDKDSKEIICFTILNEIINIRKLIDIPESESNIYTEYFSRGTY